MTDYFSSSIDLAKLSTWRVATRGLAITSHPFTQPPWHDITSTKLPGHDLTYPLSVRIVALSNPLITISFIIAIVCYFRRKNNNEVDKFLLRDIVFACIICK